MIMLLYSIHGITYTNWQNAEWYKQ